MNKYTSNSEAHLARAREGEELIDRMEAEGLLINRAAWCSAIREMAIIGLHYVDSYLTLEAGIVPTSHDERAMRMVHADFTQEIRDNYKSLRRNGRWAIYEMPDWGKPELDEARRLLAPLREFAILKTRS